MPGDEAQLIAADELCGRGWMYHKRWKVWMAAAPNTAPTKGPRGERGSYNVWDINVSHLRMGSPYCSFLVLVWHLLLVEALAGCSWRTICAETVTLLCQHIRVHAVRDGQVHPSCRPTQEPPSLTLCLSRASARLVWERVTMLHAIRACVHLCVQTWEVNLRSDIEIIYEDVETPPRLPRPKQSSQPTGPPGPGVPPSMLSAAGPVGVAR